MNDIDRMRFESLQDSYDSLKQQLAEAQRDAERYRWMVKNDMTSEYSDYTEERLNKRPHGFKYDLDAAIDQAMREGE